MLWSFNVFKVKQNWNYKFGVLVFISILVFSLLVHFTYLYPHAEECRVIDKFSYLNSCHNF